MRMLDNDKICWVDRPLSNLMLIEDYDIVEMAEKELVRITGVPKDKFDNNFNFGIPKDRLDNYYNKCLQKNNDQHSHISSPIGVPIKWLRSIWEYGKQSICSTIWRNRS